MERRRRVLLVCILACSDHCATAQQWHMIMYTKKYVFVLKGYGQMDGQIDRMDKLTERMAERMFGLSAAKYILTL
jgi:hypothetical protein